MRGVSDRCSTGAAPSLGRYLHFAMLTGGFADLLATTNLPTRSLLESTIECLQDMSKSIQQGPERRVWHHRLWTARENKRERVSSDAPGELRTSQCRGPHTPQLGWSLSCCPGAKASIGYRAGRRNRYSTKCEANPRPYRDGGNYQVKATERQ